MADNDETMTDEAPMMHGEVLPPMKNDVSPIVAAEINQQVATARRFPRRRDKEITDEIMGRAAFDEETAAECMYSLPRAGKDITGPSIRFAELVFVSYGNLRAGARFIDLDTKDHRRAAVIIEGVCLDLQSNVAQNIPVRRSIVGKKGVFNADMTNIAFSAGAAIARREAILKTVPKAIWGPAYKRVISVLQGDATTLKDRREKIMAAFARREIKPERVFAAINVKSIEDVTVEHLPRLFGMLTAMADGSETADSLFGAAPGAVAGGERHNPLSDDEPTGGEGEAAQATETASEAQGQPAEAAKPAEASPPAAQNEPAATQQAAKPAEATQASPPKAQEASKGGQPTNEAEYEAHLKGWLPSLGSGAAIKDRWAAEKKLRTDCKIGGDKLEALIGIRDARIAEVSKG